MRLGVRVVEKGGDFDGAWYWNRYPGSHCDIESHVYLPMLDETGYSPEWKYAPGEEIRCHAMRIAEQFGLYGGIVETCGSAFHATWVFTHAGRVEDRRRDDRARNARQGAWGDQHLAALASTRQDSSRASRPSATN